MKYCSTLFFVLIVLFSCDQENETVKTEYYSTKEVKFIKHYKDKLLDGEAIWFYQSGSIKEKTLFRKGKAEGHTYSFYPNGRLESYRYFTDDKEVGIGLDYYNHYRTRVKFMLYFNNSGHIYYKRNFDENGKFLSDEGKKPGNQF